MILLLVSGCAIGDGAVAIQFTTTVDCGHGMAGRDIAGGVTCTAGVAPNLDPSLVLSPIVAP